MHTFAAQLFPLGGAWKGPPGLEAAQRCTPARRRGVGASSAGRQARVARRHRTAVVEEHNLDGIKSKKIKGIERAAVQSTAVAARSQFTHLLASAARHHTSHIP